MRVGPQRVAGIDVRRWTGPSPCAGSTATVPPVAGLDQATRDQAILTTLRGSFTRLGVLPPVTRTPVANEGTIRILAALAACGAPTEKRARSLRRRDFLACLGDHKRQARGNLNDDGVRPDPVCRPRTMERALGLAPVLAQIALREPPRSSRLSTP